VPEARFAIASFNEKQAQIARAQAAEFGFPVDVFVGRTPELIALARCCTACSGSVSLELLYYAKPAVILYRVGRVPYLVARHLFMKVRYITLVNLLAADEPFLPNGAKYDPQQACDASVPLPEYLTYDDRSGQIAEHVIQWLNNDREYQRRVAMLSALRRQFAAPGASRRATDYILSHLAAPSSPLGGPHFALTGQEGKKLLEF
jgi:lipid-A-disaccharide synthase